MGAKCCLLCSGSYGAYAAYARDVVKFGEVLPRRTDLCVTQQASSETNSNYGFGQTYHNINRAYPHSHHPYHPPYHPYKSDALNQYSRQQNVQYAYDQDRYYDDHTYQNYDVYVNGNAPFEALKASLYRTPADYADYYNQYGMQDGYEFGEKELSRAEQNAYHKSQLPYEAFSEPEPTLPPQRKPRKLTGYGGYPNGHASYLLDPTTRYHNHRDSSSAYRPPHSSRHKNLQKDTLEPQEPPSDLYEPQKLLGGVSAGELLGKTHEELVLLLIQLRRHQSALLAARKHTSLEKEAQSHLVQLDTDGREDHLTRITYLDEHLLDLDKQYQMGKPLINLVDNMVKLGSLYRGSYPVEPEQKNYGTQDSLEFSRRMLEKRILAEDRMQLDSVAPDQINLEDKVMQLYKLEKKLQEESLSIQDLQRNKEMLERTLDDLNQYAYNDNDNMVEIDRRTTQRDHLERELSSLRSHLAVSARRLEETATENSHLEHEMMMLRQKIQTNMARNLHRSTLGTNESHHIESEMLRVQSLLEELQKRRMDLSQQIQRLTSSQNNEDEYPSSPTDLPGSMNARRKIQTTWLETDLDMMTTKDRSADVPPINNQYRSYNSYTNYTPTNLLDYSKEANINESDYVTKIVQATTATTLNNLDRFDVQYPNEKPIYHQDGDTFDSSVRQYDYAHREHNKPDGQEQISQPTHIDIRDADDRTKRFYGIIPKEKPLEPRTVRVVKRESTERKRERIPVSKKDSSLAYVAEDEFESNSDTGSSDAIPSYKSKTTSLPRSYGRKGLERLNQPKSTYAQNALARPNNLPLRSKQTWKSKNDQDSPDDAQLFAFNNDEVKVDEAASVFKSAAAQEIVKEMTWEAEKHKRAVPREKRRHFTISSSKPVSLETGGCPEEGARSRDDCDMVRALRPRNHPDVVKSTLSTRDLRINETTIDNIFGAPNKISIPERYMPDDDDERKLSVTEKLQRQEKARCIRKMLTDSTTSITKEDQSESGDVAPNQIKTAAERKEREHLLSLNQLLAKQVMEKSRMVAVATSPRSES